MAPRAQDKKVAGRNKKEQPWRGGVTYFLSRPINDSCLLKPTELFYYKLLPAVFDRNLRL